MNIRTSLFGFFVSLLLCSVASAQHYARFVYQGETLYGRVDGNLIHVIQGSIFPMGIETAQSVAISEVEWLPPTDARKVFAVGMNFSSHRSSRASGPPPLFLKLPTSLTGHNTSINLPSDATNVHFEGELVLVIGKRAKNVSEQEAASYIFGVTVGNDLTERSWQSKDLQWLRGKAADGFGPVGPVIATNIDYNNTLLTTRLNGEIVQQENTENMIHSPAKVVSYLSRYFTLTPGDLIFMGTPGKTRSLKNDDVVSVEIDGIGLLSNRIVKLN